MPKPKPPKIVLSTPDQGPADVIVISIPGGVMALNSGTSLTAMGGGGGGGGINRLVIGLSPFEKKLTEIIQ